MSNQLFTLSWEGVGKATLRERGRIVKVQYSTNFLTNAGIKHLAAELSLTPEAHMGWMTIGDGEGQTKTDTQLAVLHK